MEKMCQFSPPFKSRIVCLLSSFMFLASMASAQHRDFILKGTIRSSTDSMAVSGASIHVLGTKNYTSSDSAGHFVMKLSEPKARIRVSHVQFKTSEWSVSNFVQSMDIFLSPQGSLIDEVEIVQTGYHALPLERATGSYAHIDEKLLNRAVGEDILSRLDNLVPGLQFKTPEGNSATDIRVRGLSTIHSDETPLIVLDNFPYEGDLKNINPADIESVTILKDASAASIWGARAGNGVIVIQSKRGRFDTPIRLNLSHNTTWKDRPDFMASHNRLPSEEILKIEKEKYEKGAYMFDNSTPVPAYVQLLDDLKQGRITSEEFTSLEELYSKTEIRQEAMKYLYRPSLQQQHSLSGTGGGKHYRFNISIGMDANVPEQVGNSARRYTMNSSGTFLIGRHTEWHTGLRYTNRWGKANGISLSSLSQSVGNEYMPLKDKYGNNLAVVYGLPFAYLREVATEGLQDWYYRPLDELNLVDRKSHAEEFFVQQILTYKFRDKLRFAVNYQLARSIDGSSTKYAKDSYYVRNLVNRFTQADGARVIPHQGIFIKNPTNFGYVHAARLQMDALDVRYDEHVLTGLIGSEIRISDQETLPGATMYNYDENLLTGTGILDYLAIYPTRPTGSSRIPLLNPNHKLRKDRFLSYFGNMGYQYREAYILTGSFRWDGSNLFGVKTNQKGTLLWSVGAGWNVLKSGLLPTDLLSHLKLRTTYGLSGNVNKSVTHYPIIRYDVNSRLNLPAAIITSIGNPSLKWENVKTTNVGLDFGIQQGKITGSLDYYIKQGYDLIGSTYLAPSTGITSDYMINYANIRTEGIDLSLTGNFSCKGVDWRSNLLSSWVSNRITNYHTPEVNDLAYYISGPVPPVWGVSKDMLYALPWNGLDPNTGFPIVYKDGVQTDDYAAYYYSRTKEDLEKVGSSIPTWYGSWRNDLAWKGLTLSFMLQFKMKYFFRKKSLHPKEEYYGSYHMDYFKRWQKPGDEKHTDVPRAIAFAEDKPMLGAAYTYTSALVLPGDQIRLNDIRLDYQIPIKSGMVKRLNVYGMVRNLGMLWTKNKEHLDPDYHYSDYPPNKIFSIGLHSSF